MAQRDGLELWGGLECTSARIGDAYRDQVRETGHDRRPEDLDDLARMGFRTLRYPVLWESVSPDRPDAADFGWHDSRLGRLRELGIGPIAGLCHHGSGPRYTDLLDPEFPRKLARHAARVARRYPWIELYTPINEPLTTARFSCLYGHWYPHRRDVGDFLFALVNQCRATVLAMRAIRRVNPDAKLVQTEDFGRVFSTEALAYQADYENGRRWLTFDLLCGTVDRHHPWWRIFRRHGIEERHLRAFADPEARPDIVGINHYLTSERFLDERVELYPPHLVGGNGRDRYADVEAVRMPLPQGELGPAARLREVWERYRRPIAVTEVHHGSTRDEQMRWLQEVWRAALAVRRDGADVRAVTAWALFGALDWNSLLTRRDGIYEPGAFDIRAPRPRPTALARQCEEIIRTGDARHAILEAPGWWKRPERFYSTPPSRSGDAAQPPVAAKVLVAGPDGPLREAIVRAAGWRGLPLHVVAPGEERLRALDGLSAGTIWAVISLPGEPASSEDALASACGRHGRPFLAIGIGPIFAGDPARPADEDDPLLPESDAALREARLRRACADALLVRAGLLFGPAWADPLVAAALTGTAAEDVPESGPALVSPTYLPDLAHVALDLLIDREVGIRHLVNGASPAADLVASLAARLGLASANGSRTKSRPPPADVRTALATIRGSLMPPLASALDRFVAECPPTWRRPVDPPIAAE